MAPRQWLFTEGEALWPCPSCSHLERAQFLGGRERIKEAGFGQLRGPLIPECQEQGAPSGRGRHFLVYTKHCQAVLGTRA